MPDTFVTLVLIVLALVALWVGWRMVQFLGRPREAAVGRVAKKTHIPRRMVVAGAGKTQTTHFTPEHYEVAFELNDGRRGSLLVARAYFDAVRVGDIRTLTIRTGRVASQAISITSAN